MTFGDSGLVGRRVGELHPELSGHARTVLGQMAIVVEIDEPRCFLSHAKIAERSGFSVSTVQRAMRELEAAGAIVRDGRTGRRTRTTVRWRLPLLETLRRLPRPDRHGSPGEDETSDAGSVPQTDKRSDSVTDAGSVPQTEKHPVQQTEKHPVQQTDNPSDPLRPQGSGGRGRSAAAVAPASAGATAVAAAASTDSNSTLVGRVMDALGFGQDAAERWIRDKLDAATTPVRNTTAYIGRCLDSERDTHTSPSKPARGRKAPGKGAGRSAPARSGTGKGSGPGRTRTAVVRDEQGRPLNRDGTPRARTTRIPESEQAEIVGEVRGGKPVDAVARDRNVKADRVQRFVRDADGVDARQAVQDGEDYAAAADRFPFAGGADRLRQWHRSHLVWTAVRAVLDDGADPGARAAEIADRVGEPVAAVRDRLADDIERARADRRRAPVGRAS